MYSLAFSGQFDRQLVDFTHWISKSCLHDCQMFGLSHRKYPALTRVSWRIGSLVSSEDTAGMIDQLDALVYFCLTPPSSLRTDEGFARDIALEAAVNIASAAQNYPNLRVVLVTRCFQNKTPKLGSCLDYWAQVIRIFECSNLNLNIVQTAPVLSEFDAASLAIFENAQQKFMRRDVSEWEKSVCPVPKKAFYEAILDAIICEDCGRCILLNGNDEISFNDWICVNQQVMPSRLLQGRLTQMRAALLPDNHLRSELLGELLEDAVPLCSDCIKIGNNPFLKVLRHHAEDILDEKMVGKNLLLEPEKFLLRENRESTCYVQRVLTRLNRPVSDIADLLVGWIPRYFQRLISVDEMSTSRVMCRVFRIPVLEFEKNIESPNRCRLILRNPWAINVKKPTSFVVTTTGNDAVPGILLVIAEDMPKNKFILSSFRAMMIAFGRYLKEYGCGM